MMIGTTLRRSRSVRQTSYPSGPPPSATSSRTTSKAVVLALLVFGLGATSAGRGPAERTVDCKAAAAGTAPITIASGGLSRSAVVHVPPAGKRGHPLPLVLAFHGAGANGGAMESYSGL